MKKITHLGLGLILSVAVQGEAQASNGYWGSPDVTSAGTVVNPLLTADPTGTMNPGDTFMTVQNSCTSQVRIAWQMWTAGGAAVSGDQVQGSVLIPAGNTWVSPFFRAAAAASGNEMTFQVSGNKLRGFMTVDVVTSNPSGLTPIQPMYPFAQTNCLLGYVYWVRLQAGAANGMDAIHIEAGLTAGSAGAPGDGLLGFYTFAGPDGDGRERIDAFARRILSLTMAPNAGPIMDISSRVFLDSAFTGSSSICLWTWSPATNGPTVAPSSAGATFPWTLTTESGVTTMGTNSFINIVNVVELTAPMMGNNSGEYIIQDIPNEWHVFAFSFNAANPPGDPSLTWEVAFESGIDLGPGLP